MTRERDSATVPPPRPGVVRYLPLGGHGHVGRNCAVLETDAGIVILDCGVDFPDDDQLGIDVILPDMRYLIEREERLLGLVLTHGHMDHIGAVVWLLKEVDIPVYGPPFALALVREALREAGIADGVALRPIHAGSTFTLGDFSFEALHVNHSIPQTLAMAIETPVGLWIHSADFKIDLDPVDEPPIDLPRLGALGDQGVRVLLSDSTNIEREGFSGSERSARQGILDVVSSASGRVFITLFSTNVARVQSAVLAAEATGRRVVPFGWSLQRNIRIARELGLLRLTQDDLIVDPEQASDLPRDQILVLTTGSQGEARAGLSRLVRGDGRGLRMERGDTVVFSSRIIPGNERGVYALRDNLARAGIHVVAEGDHRVVHVSGHAYRDEHRTLIRLLRPDLLIPVHGDYRFLRAQAELGEQLGVGATQVMDNGMVLEVSSSGARVTSTIALRPQVVEGTSLAELGGPSMRERAKLAKAGLCVVRVVVDRDTGALLDGPLLLGRGISDEGDDDQQIEEARGAAEEAFRDLPDSARREARAVEEALRTAVRRTFRRISQRKPIVEVMVSLV